MSKETSDKALEAFADLVIEKIKEIKSDWTKPWVSSASLRTPKNLDNRPYNGTNALLLYMLQEKNNWNIPLYATFNRISSLNYDEENGKKVQKKDDQGNPLPFVSVKKGSSSIPILYMSITVIDKETKQTIPYDDYKNMSKEERSRYEIKPRTHVYPVFNVAAQTNIAASRPELYAKLIEPYTGEQKEKEQTLAKDEKMRSMRAMIDNGLWLCPIMEIENSDRAFYSTSKDEIKVPQERQFKHPESFFSTTTHEMAHSTGSENRLGRLKPAVFGSEDYAKEELVAELTAALVCAERGIEKTLKEDTVPYLQSWLSALDEDPNYIKTLLPQIKSAERMITSRLDAIDKLMNLGCDLSRYSREEISDYEQELKSEKNDQIEAEVQENHKSYSLR